VVSAEPFSHETGTLRCLQKEMVTYTDLCACVETETMSHIVESCPVTKLNGGLSPLHSVDEDTVSQLTGYGSWFMTRIQEEEEEVKSVGTNNVCTCYAARSVLLCIILSCLQCSRYLRAQLFLEAELSSFFALFLKTRGQSNLTKSAHSPVRGHPRGSKFVPLNSWGTVFY